MIDSILDRVFWTWSDVCSWMRAAGLKKPAMFVFYVYMFTLLCLGLVSASMPSLSRIK